MSMVSIGYHVVINKYSKRGNMKKEILKQKNVRLPENLIWKLKEAALKNRRSEYQEIIIRLEKSFDD
ncbi:Arc family DNA-binding protein [Xenorhabdus lircayensis]|uniref:Arc family DNA-binding protein n=1 Tax=Xenorhabdus lircayensis TaxID=2763499 RepID=A0ABS0U3W2_9GAMM|nr:Arc family DNA-binding protein [Xenorhabdus lircayensis]MBI6548582.1 Arc family DNA-binding protein [Xenorhabdus lircayensis]